MITIVSSIILIVNMIVLISYDLYLEVTHEFTNREVITSDNANLIRK